MIKKLLIILINFLIIPFCVLSQSKKLEIRMHNRVYYDVFSYLENGDTLNLTNFAPWVEIRDLKISPDSSYFFFRYKEKGEAYRLVLFDFIKLRKVSESIPGYGGSFEWNSQNQILHSWGCGSNCANLCVYNLNLEKIFFTLSSGGFEYSPDKTIVAQLSMQYNQIWVFDLNSLNQNKGLKGYTQSINYDLDWENYRFKSNNFIVLDSNPSHNIDLSKIEWKILDPEDMEQFYTREMNK